MYVCSNCFRMDTKNASRFFGLSVIFSANCCSQIGNIIVVEYLRIFAYIYTQICAHVKWYKKESFRENSPCFEVSHFRVHNSNSTLVRSRRIAVERVFRKSHCTRIVIESRICAFMRMLNMNRFTAYTCVYLHPSPGSLGNINEWFEW